MTKFMEINGLKCRINLPNAPKGEKVHNLPPYKLQQVHKVDDYNCPANWMNGSAKAASYFVAVDPGKHLWLDFNDNWHHTHHVAIVLSVQGINPITGQKTDVLRLEQYRDKCPKHDLEFQEGRFCATCGYKWPAQNYLSTTNSPHGLLWIDGWRADDGQVRGFLITEETMRGVAAQLIGQDRVYAIGIAFYLSKKPKEEPLYGRGRAVATGIGTSSDWAAYSYKAGMHSSKRILRSSGIGGSSARGLSSSFSCSVNAAPEPAAFPVTSDSVETDYETADSIMESAKVLEIGAGAKITQELGKLDKTALDFFEDAPAGLLYVNYVDSAAAEAILANGARDRTKGGEGFLAGLETGN